ncbi:MAG: hypothetical protein DRQ46_00215 [Gammaproteobacteria bacterium]|nr:MAG: hypothetical protein DRQ46_00215 [Gammaproteobacteria bacterium]
MDFTDAKGRKWLPKVTVNTIRRFEDRTGVGTIEAFVKGMTAAADFEEKNAGIEIDSFTEASNRIIEMSVPVWGNVGHLAIFLYESCGVEKHGLSLDDFCEAIESDQILQAMQCALNALVSFFPEPSEASKAKAETVKGDEAPL